MKNEPDRGRGGWACAATGLAGALFTIFCFYPGYMSPDSFMQLGQARSGQFNDWHPPVMSFLWRLLDRIHPGPAGMLAFHSILFWTAVALLCCTLARRVGPLCVVVFGLFPPVIAILGTIWKDVGFGASFLLVYALLLDALHRRSKVAWLASLLPLFYGIAVRHNAVVAAVPLALFAGYVWSVIFRNHSTRRIKLIAGIAVLVSIYVLSAFVNSALIHGRKTYIYQTMLMHDLVAISMPKGNVSLPAWTYGGGQPLTVPELKRIYHTETVVPLFCGDSSIRLLQQSTNGEDIRMLWKAWLPAVRDNPGAYLAHRWETFKALIGIRAEVCYPYHSGVDANDLGLSLHSSTINKVVMKVLDRLKNTVLFRAWFYLLIILFALAIVPWRWPELRLPVLVLGTSALLNQALYFFAVPTCDFRYNWWCVLTALCLLLHLAIHKLKG